MADPRLLAQLPFTLSQTNFPALGERYQGKVRDTYRRGDRLVLITTDRLSAFDHVLTTVPFKGELLNQLAHFWFRQTAHVVRNHVLDQPDPCVTVARRAAPYPIEFVVRAYLTGSLWRDYQAGRDPYGLRLPPGLRKDQRLEPVLTPSTKEAHGAHDQPVSEAELVARRLISSAELGRAKEAALALFAEGQNQLAARGLLLVDTKYEFGLADGELLAIDELHTPDSSRFWVAAEYERRFARAENQLMLDKENIRQWLIEECGFTGQGVPPPIPDHIRVDLAATYLTAFQTITGEALDLRVGEVSERLAANLRRAGLI